VNSRAVVVAFVVVALAAGGYLFGRNLKHADRSENVADAPAGGRTQATPDSMTAVTPPGDPLEAGIPETPDIPADSPHSGLKKMGIRIREAVLADGNVGDHETPGIDFTGLSQKQRNWYLTQATDITCSCGCRQDLLECRRDDATCPISPGLSDSLLAEARKH
jgi:hypothetical protein